MLRQAFAAALALSLAGSGCAKTRIDAGQSASASALTTAVVTLTPSAGKPHRYTVEIARTEAEQARGLMFRKTMARNAGMIFPMRPARFASFWMENTLIPLDIIFIAPDGKVLNVVTGTPLSRDQLNSVAPVSAVLELNGGEAARIGLEPGDAVSGRY